MLKEDNHLESYSIFLVFPFSFSKFPDVHILIPLSSIQIFIDLKFAPGFVPGLSNAKIA